MPRLLTNLLVALALLMQAGSGALASSSPCCRIPKAPVKQCCAHKAEKRGMHACPCHPQDNRCRCIATADTRATPTAGPRTVSVDQEVAAAPIPTPRPVLFPLLRSHTPPAPPAHESPPGLPRAVSLPLLL
jgi:hypothetical protein